MNAIAEDVFGSPPAPARAVVVKEGAAGPSAATIPATRVTAPGSAPATPTGTRRRWSLPTKKDGAEPVAVLVALLGVALLLGYVSVSGEISVGKG